MQRSVLYLFWSLWHPIVHALDDHVLVNHHPSMHMGHLTRNLCFFEHDLALVNLPACWLQRTVVFSDSFQYLNPPQSDVFLVTQVWQSIPTVVTVVVISTSHEDYLLITRVAHQYVLVLRD